MYDLIIKNATLIDGTGGEPLVADVAISAGKICKIGSVETGAQQVIDAIGRVVTPGFVDSHSHSDLSLASNQDQEDAVRQGITFAITGLCGGAIAPSALSGYSRFAQFAAEMQDRPTSMYAAVLAGHGSLRNMVAGRENRLLTDEELTRMCLLLEESMDEGCMGLSLGLTYPPGSYADFRELAALAKVVGDRGGILSSHIRNESDDLIPSVEELISLCEVGKCRGVISHLKAADKKNHGKVKTVLAMLEAAAERGVEVYADAYPYCASATTLSSRFIPRQFHPPGTTSVVRLLDDPALRQQIKTWATEKWGTDLSWVLVTSCPSLPQYIGLNMNEIAEKMGIADRYEAVFTLLQESKGYCSGCFTMMCEEDVVTALAHPLVMVGCDSNMGKKLSQHHPRRVAAFPRVLGYYVREQQITTLPEMIRKITSLPAKVYGLENKGLIKEGYDADLCIFDPETIRDTADYVNCKSRNVGIDYVIVNGKIVVEQGEYNGTRAASLYIR